MTIIAPTLQWFFTDRLTRQLQASPRTIASYRDTLKLLLAFAQEQTGKQPSKLDWEDLNETLIARFLDHLETGRGNSPRTRNLRLTAIRSLFKYAALRHPEHAAVIAQVLSIPPKRHEKRQVTFLTADEAQALIDAPDRSRWEGRRDRALLTLAIQAGLRVSELIALDCGDSCSAPARMFAAKAKDESTGLCRSPPPRRPSSPPGSASAPDDPQIRCSPPGPAAGSAATRSSNASTPTPRPQPDGVTHSPTSSYTHTCSATAARCRCCKPASTPPSSRSGSATPMFAPPSPTSTPTSRSRRKRSRSSPQPT